MKLTNLIVVLMAMAYFPAMAQDFRPPFPGGPPPRMPFPGGFGEPQRPKVGGKEIDSDEYIDAREEKFKEILTPHQYSTWRRRSGQREKATGTTLW